MSALQQPRVKPYNPQGPTSQKDIKHLFILAHTSIIDALITHNSARVQGNKPWTGEKVYYITLWNYACFFLSIV